jgi:hypothetical protein
MTLILEADGWASGVVSVLFGGMMRSAIRREAAGFARHATAVR